MLHRGQLVRRLLGVGVIAASALTPLTAAGTAIARSNFCSPGADTVPPQVDALTLSTKAVNVSHGPQPVTVTIHATDTSAGAVSGVKSIEVELEGPREGIHGLMTRTSGTSDDGTWRLTLTVPPTAISTTWHVRLVRIRDFAQNTQYYIREGKVPQEPTRLQAGWDENLTVSGSPTSASVKAGRLTSFALSPSTVDATHGDKSVRVTARFAAAHPRSVSVSFTGRAATGPRLFERVKLRHRSGPRWVGDLSVSKWTGDLSLRTRVIAARYGADSRGRFHFIYARQLRARHLPSAVRVTSRIDDKKPVLSNLVVTPTSADTTAGPEQLSVTATVPDSQSGTSRVVARFYVPRHGPHSQGGFGYARLTQHDDTWAGPMTIGTCVGTSDWKIGVYIIDNRGNHIDYTSTKLAAAGLPSQVAVTSDAPADLDPPGISSATASGVSHTITLDFSEGVKNVTSSTLTVYALAPKADRFAAPLSIDAIDCFDASAVVDCDGSGGLVTSTQLHIADIAGGKRYAVFANQGAVTSQLTDGAGNPLSWDYTREPVTGA
jgi:hypothetical protein